MYGMSSSRGWWATVNIIVVSCLLASLYPDLSVDEVLLERRENSEKLRAACKGGWKNVKWVNPTKRQLPASEEQKNRKVMTDAKANMGKRFPRGNDVLFVMPFRCFNIH